MMIYRLRMYKVSYLITIIFKVYLYIRVCGHPLK
jgi:hypothetical protein